MLAPIANPVGSQRLTPTLTCACGSPRDSTRSATAAHAPTTAAYLPANNACYVIHYNYPPPLQSGQRSYLSHSGASHDHSEALDHSGSALR